MVISGGAAARFICFRRLLRRLQQMKHNGVPAAARVTRIMATLIVSNQRKHAMRTHWTRLLHVDLLGIGAGSNGTHVVRSRSAARHGPFDQLVSALHSWARTALRAVRSAATAYARYRRTSVLRAELRSLDDDVLRDLAIYRSEIDSVVAEITGDATPTRRQTSRATDDAAPMELS